MSQKCTVVDFARKTAMPDSLTAAERERIERIKKLLIEDFAADHDPLRGEVLLRKRVRTAMRTPAEVASSRSLAAI